MGDLIRFCLVVLCFAMSLAYGKRVVDKRNAMLLRMALLFTVFADFCLLITGQYAAGVAFFCVVQLLYALRYGNARACRILLAVAAVVFAALFFVAQTDIVIACCAAYALCFCCNLFLVIRQFRAEQLPFPNRLLALAGMFLFAACDINVALYNSGLTLAGALIWPFYLPSQVCLALSGRRYSGA